MNFRLNFERSLEKRTRFAKTAKMGLENLTDIMECDIFLTRKAERREIESGNFEGRRGL